MKYRESKLAENEHIVFDVHHHAWSLVMPSLLALLLPCAWIALLVVFGPRGWLVIAGGAVTACSLLYLLWRLLEWSHTNLVLTDRRLIYAHGVLGRHSRETPVAAIRDATTYQGFLGRLLRAGDLMVRDSQGAVKQAFLDVPGPEFLRSRIMEQANPRDDAAGGEAMVPTESPEELALRVASQINRSQPTVELTPLPPERPPLYSEIVDQIERLDAMRQRGVLSDEEFERAKHGLIDRIGEVSEG